jgi:acyl-homoserine-lactone acylase
MRTTARRLPGAALLGLALLWTACSTPAPAPPATNPEPTAAEILWDTWGIPHLFAPDDESLFYAHGWAQAHAHGDLLLRLYGESRGRAAEYWGEDSLDSDRWVHTVRIPERAAEWLAAQTPEARGWLDAFAAGINDYAARHPERIADDVEPVLPVSAVDVLAHVQRAIHFTFLTDASAVSAAGRHLAFEPRGAERGSNAWAVAPSRSASGHALLLANPHLPWSDLFTWFEVQMTSTGAGEDGLDLYGAALVGMPFVAIGFNDHLAWTHTVNTLDGFDLYEIELAPGGRGGYLWDGALRAFEDEDTVTLRVKQEDGSLREEDLSRRSSVHGPVIAATEEGGRAVALRVAGLDRPHLIDQYRAMAGAHDLGELEAALRREQAPMFTVMAADGDGRVMHLFDGRVPVLPAGGSVDWQAVVPGTGPETLWTEVHPYDALPRVVDPASGWLQNANDPPWTTTFPRALDPDDYPAGMAPRSMHLRAQRSARMLMEDDSITLDELIADKYSTRMELADRILDDLARAVDEHGDDTARRAMEVLASWDREADPDSRGAVLFLRFFEELRRASGAEPWAVEWDPERPLETPDELADPAAAAAALGVAARGVEADHGALDVPWGEVFRFRVGGRDLPADGAPGQLGVFRVVYYGPGADESSPIREARGGDSFIAAVELSDPVRARTVIPYGNASQPGSPHAGDQIEVFAAKELRPVWRERAEIEEHLERRELVAPEGGER